MGETSSKQILKTPKRRNPLSDLTYLDSENEFTENIKTRRVSFANANVIQKFATDAEKNTIWFDKYEESLNHTTSTENSTFKQQTDSSSDDSDNLNCTKIGDFDISIERVETDQNVSLGSSCMDLTIPQTVNDQPHNIYNPPNEFDMDFTITDIDLNNKENVPVPDLPISTHYHPQEMEITQKLSAPTHFPTQPISFTEMEVTRCLHPDITRQNNLNHSEMDITQQLQSESPQQPVIQIQLKKPRQTIHFNQSIDITEELISNPQTQIINKVVEEIDCNRIPRRIGLCDNPRQCSSALREIRVVPGHFSEVATSADPYSNVSKSGTCCNISNQVNSYCNTSQRIDPYNNVLKQTDVYINGSYNNASGQIDYHNNSTKITGHVGVDSKSTDQCSRVLKSAVHLTRVENNEEDMDFTERIPLNALKVKSRQTVHYNNQEGEMELTEKLPGVFYPPKQTQTSNEDMDFTERLLPNQLKPKSRQIVHYNKQEGEMELTERLPGVFYPPKQAQTSNEDMEFTDRLPLNQLKSKSRQTVHYNNQEGEMELTEKLPGAFYHPKQAQTSNEDMDFTERLPPNQLKAKARQTVHFSNQEGEMELTDELSKVFHPPKQVETGNKNMVFTERLLPNQLKIKPRQTVHYNNQEGEMELTEELSGVFYPPTRAQTGNENMNFTEGLPANTLKTKSRPTVYYNHQEEEMELTEKLPGVFHPPKQAQTGNDDMDFTEKLPVNHLKMKSRQTVHFNNQEGEMDLTEKLPGLCYPEKMFKQTVESVFDDNHGNIMEESVREQCEINYNDEMELDLSQQPNDQFSQIKIQPKVELSSNTGQYARNEQLIQPNKRQTIHFNNEQIEMDVTQTQNDTQRNDMEFTKVLPLVRTVDCSRQTVSFLVDQSSQTFSNKEVEKVGSILIDECTQTENLGDVKLTRNDKDNVSNVMTNKGNTENVQNTINNDTEKVQNVINDTENVQNVINDTENIQNVINDTQKVQNIINDTENIQNDKENVINVTENIQNVINDTENIQNVINDTENNRNVTNNRENINENLQNVLNNLENIRNIENDKENNVILINKDETIEKMDDFAEKIPMMCNNEKSRSLIHRQTVYTIEDTTDVKLSSKITIDDTTDVKLSSKITIEESVDGKKYEFEWGKRTQPFSVESSYDNQFRELAMKYQLQSTKLADEEIPSFTSGKNRRSINHSDSSKIDVEVSSRDDSIYNLGVDNDSADNLCRAIKSMQFCMESTVGDNTESSMCITENLTRCDNTIALINYKIECKPRSEYSKIINEDIDTDILKLDETNRVGIDVDMSIGETTNKTVDMIDNNESINPYKDDTNIECNEIILRIENEMEADVSLHNDKNDSLGIFSDSLLGGNHEFDSNDPVKADDGLISKNRLESPKVFGKSCIIIESSLDSSCNDLSNDKNVSKAESKSEYSSDFNSSDCMIVENNYELKKHLGFDFGGLRENLSENVRSLRDDLMSRLGVKEMNEEEIWAEVERRYNEEYGCCKTPEELNERKRVRHDEKPEVKEKECIKTKDYVTKIKEMRLPSWRIVELGAGFVDFTTLDESFLFEVKFEYDTGVVTNISFYSLPPDEEIRPYDKYVLELFHRKITVGYIESSCGKNYTILSLLDFITLQVEEMEKIIRELEDLSVEYGINVDTNLNVNITFRSFRLRWLFDVELNLMDLEDITPDKVRFVTNGVFRKKDMRLNDIKSFVTEKPKDYKFLRSYIESVNTYMEMLEKKHKNF